MWHTGRIRDESERARITRAAIALGPYSHQIFNSDQPLTSLKLLVDRYILPTLPAKVAELHEICQEADLLISVASQFAASIVVELLQIPWIAVILTPSASIAAQPMRVPLSAHLQRLSNRLVSGRDISPPDCRQTGEPAST